MKKVVSTLFVCLLVQTALTSQVASAHESGKENDFNITVNPLALLFGQFNAGFHVGVSEKMTLGLTGGYLNYGLGTTSLTAASFGLRMNYYLSGPRLSDGWYLGVLGEYNPMSFTQNSATASFSSFDFGPMIGYHWVYTSGFNMMLGGGAAYYTTSTTATLSNGTLASVPAFTGIQPKLEFNLGFAF